MLEQKMLKSLEFEFTGTAGEYFRVWIVNVLLTILTLGIYSAWAKVRNKQYFYGNTILDDSPFEYTASPIAILKGRLIVVGVFAIYAMIIVRYPLAEGLFYITLFLLLPWLVMRSLMFNARYSSYRNLSFAFNKDLKGAFIVFVVFGILIIFTLGLIYPYLLYRIQLYRVSNHSFGQYGFDLKRMAGKFYKYYILGALVFILGMFVIGIIFGGTLGTIFGTIEQDIESETAVLPQIGILVTLLILGAYLFVYYLAFAYVKAKIFNVVWSGTSLSKRSFHVDTRADIPLVAFTASLDYQRLLYIYLTNTLAILFSLGLLIPWAKIRLARYRIDNMTVSSIADLKSITAAQRAQVGAVGSEMGDFLNIDVGL